MLLYLLQNYHIIIYSYYQLQYKFYIRVCSLQTRVQHSSLGNKSVLSKTYKSVL